MNDPTPRTGAGRHRLVEALTVAGVTTSSRIYVPGDAALPMLLWLCARGYAHVVHVSQSVAPIVEAGAALIVPRTVSLADLDRILAGCARVAPGGLIVVQTARSERRTLGDAIDDAMVRAGFWPEATATVSPTRQIHVARRATAVLKRAA